MADEITEAQEARRLAAEWRMKAAQIEDRRTRKCMEQLGADFAALAGSWLAIAELSEKVTVHGE
jgi:hypothetical protein